MHAFDVLGEPVRRRILELLADREHASGEVVEVIHAEFGLSQPAVCPAPQGPAGPRLVHVRPDGARRLYALDPAPLREVDGWLHPFRRFWDQRLDVLETEVRRGKRRT